MKQLACVAAAAMVVAACGGGGGSNSGSNTGNQANAAGGNASAEAGATLQQPLRGPGGEDRGLVTLTETPQGLQVRVEATGLPPGEHGAHVHMVGQCAPPDFASAGAHWNPTNRQHGTQNPAGSHLGDAPNLTVGTDGRGTLEHVLAGARLRGGAPAIMDADGGAVVIHAKADDYRTDPSGDSGDRIACASFR